MKRIIFGLLIATVSFFVTPISAEKGALSDAQLAQILITANTGEVNEAQLALKKANNGELKAFANHMITDHSSSKKETAALASKLNLKLVQSDISRKLQKDSKANIAILRKKKGSALDQAYADAQVKAHSEVLDLFDTTLIPNAKNADLKALFTKTRPIIASHLEHAQKALAELDEKN